MYRRAPIRAAQAALLACSVAVAYAGDDLDSSELRLVITGNTIEARGGEDDADYKMYFHPDGRWVRRQADGKTDTGHWSISAKGALCTEPRTDHCRRVKQLGEGQYELYDPQGELESTIGTVTVGNPDGLKAPATP